MSHIHTAPNQHDMTISAYIVLVSGGERRCLVHHHKKIEKLMQVGGHIEVDETPWQSVQHEVLEESGYQLSELKVLQPTKDQVKTSSNIAHPVPILMNTHHVGGSHYHSDLCYAFVAETEPSGEPAQEESADIRWLTLKELQLASEANEAIKDVALLYEFILDHLSDYVWVEAKDYSLAKPQDVGIKYKAGAPDA